MSQGKELALPDLSPQEFEAIRLYTDPLLPTFGNKRAAIRAAGYADSNYSTRFFDRAEIAAEVQRITAQRIEQGNKVAEYLGDYAWDAARELVNQLSLGRDLEVIDARVVLGEDVLQSFEYVNVGPDRVELRLKSNAAVPHEAVMEQVKNLNNHNRAAILAAKERREAAKLLLAYKIGTPEQRIRVTDDRDKGNGPLDLSKLSKDELEALGSVVHSMIAERKKAPQQLTAEPVREADYEMEN